MRIHIIDPSIHMLSGVSKLTVDLAIALKKYLHDSLIMIHGPAPFRDLAFKIKSADISYNIVQMDTLIKSKANILFKGLLQFRDNLKAIKAISKDIDRRDIVIFTDGFYLAPFLRKYSQAKIIIYHYFPYSLSYRWWKTDFMLLEQGLWSNDLATNLAKMEAILYKQNFVDVVVVYSRFVASVFRKYLNLPSVVIPPPIDTKLYKPLPKNRSTILAVTRFHPSKELDKIIIIFVKGLMPHNNEAKLIIAGRVLREYEWYYRLLLKLAERSRGRVAVIPSPQEKKLAELYGTSEIFWYIHQEHCATTPVEAMAAGAVPVILDKPGLREAIIHLHDGIIAKNIGEFLKWSLKLLKDESLLRTLSVNARKSAITRFSIESFGLRFSKLISTLAKI